MNNDTPNEFIFTAPESIDKIFTLHPNGDMTIMGTRYSYELLYALGCDDSTTGQVIEILKKEDGLVSCRRLYDIENFIKRMAK
ncbi:MAG: hypothetical protein ACO20X_14880 [Alphaproteobacteria bacterium]